MEHLFQRTVTIERAMEPEDNTKIVRLATVYGAEVHIRKEFFPGEPPLGGLTREASAKSVLGMLSLKLQQGDKIDLITYGEDGERACQEILTFLNGA
ncbi:MAG: HPr family phosphocarrier protein [Tumebacillaceae bacterium]